MLVEPIPITVQDGAKNKELVLLEFQGDFEHTDMSEPDQFRGLELGSLVEKPMGNYELTVGNHLLKGKTCSFFCLLDSKLTIYLLPQVKHQTWQGR